MVKLRLRKEIKKLLDYLFFILVITTWAWAIIKLIEGGI